MGPSALLAQSVEHLHGKEGVVGSSPTEGFRLGQGANRGVVVEPRGIRCRLKRLTDLPAGTVTFLFSDIEGSTGLLKRLGDEYATLIADHRGIIRDTFGAHGGMEIDGQGDSFFFAFARAREAVAAAVTAQRAHAIHKWPGGEKVRVRMGLHTGEPAVEAEGYLGVDVVRAARLSAAARGGHVLLSETTRALLGSNFPEGVSLHPLGERRLKDIEEPERVYQLAIDGVEQPETEPGSTASSEIGRASCRERVEI